MIQKAKVIFNKGNEYLEARFSALKSFVMEEIYDINKKLETHIRI